MAYYFEIWLRGFVKDYAYSISKYSSNYKPHITFIRPFKEMQITEKQLLEKTVNYCKNFSPIPYTLEGQGNFDNKYFFIPIVDSKELLQFNNGLEKVFENDVVFYPKLDNQKNLHLTINTDKPISSAPKFEENMLRMTLIKNSKIFSSYDFVTHQLLNREQSLDKKLWSKTSKLFEKMK